MPPPAPPPTRDPLGLVGKTIDEKYRVERLVGEGGFGVVYRAEHVLWKRPVALKCFRLLARIGEEARRRLVDDFIREGALLSELSARSVAIVQARDVGTLTSDAGERVPYMALEWLEGESLAELLDRRRRAAGGAPAPWGLGAALALLEPVARALALAHRRGIAHRDVKPGNVFVVRAGDGDDGPRVKLLDFGIAKVVQAMAEQGFTKTAEGPASFTPSYGAPEQFDRKLGPTGPWTDVFALALVFVELLAGREALEGDDTFQLGFASTNRAERPTPRALGVDVSDGLEAVFQKALAVHPRERYASASEFWAALGAALPPARPADDGFWASLPDAGGARVDALAATAAMAETAPRPSPGAAAARGGPGPAAATGGGGANAAATGGAAAGGAPADAPADGKVRGASARKGLTRAAVGLGAIGLAAGALVLRGVASGGSARAPAAPPAPPAPSHVFASPSARVGPAPTASEAALGCPLEMILVPGGTFSMGSDEGDEAEQPVHSVKLSAYCLDRREVTVRDYRRCVTLGDCIRPPEQVEWEGVSARERRAFSPLCNADDDGRKDHPVNCVDWGTAEAYCAFAGKRLPTEAEWEFAARGPGGGAYPWGDEPPTREHVNACGAECVRWLKERGEPAPKALYEGDDGFAGTAPAGSFARGRSRQGFDDLAGNVWEWTSDFSGPYAPGPQADPKGPPRGARRVLRGGGFNAAQARWLRPSRRWSDAPAARSHVYGFRCAKAPGAGGR